MARADIESRVREKIDAKIARLEEKLANLANEESLQERLHELEEQMAGYEEAMQELDMSDERSETVAARLEAKRERLVAKQERIELKMELLQEKRDRYQEAIDGLRETYSETVHEAMTAHSVAARRPRPYKSSAANTSRMQEEQRKILEMVQNGKITADEAARLLDALRSKEQQHSDHRRKPRWVRIRVTDTNEERVRVHLTLPIGLVRAGLRAGGSIAGVEGLDTAGLEEMLNRGEVGHLLNYEDNDDGERVEIFVE